MSLAWGWPALSGKAHVFNGDGRSLCGRWLFTGANDSVKMPSEGDPKRGPDDCAACHKKLAAHFAKVRRL